MTDTLIKIENLHKNFGKNEVLKGINLEIKKGEVVVIIGPSGSGKSTLLRSMNLLEEATKGKVIFEGVDITDKKNDLFAMREKMGMVFQQFNLFPNMTVMENITLSPIKTKGESKEVAEKRAHELLEKVGLPDKADAYPQSLSGGQQQRIGLAQVLAQAPEVLLLDEPFSQTDSFLKNKIRQNLFTFLKENRITCIIATHESNEALGFSDKIMILQEGRQLLIDTPDRVYHTQNEYIASLFDLVNKVNKGRKRLLLYPHQITIVPQSDWKVIIQNCFFQGSHYLIVCKEDKGELIYVRHTEKIEKGKKVFLEVKK